MQVVQVQAFLALSVVSDICMSNIAQAESQYPQSLVSVKEVAFGF